MGTWMEEREYGSKEGLERGWKGYMIGGRKGYIYMKVGLKEGRE